MKPLEKNIEWTAELHNFTGTEQYYIHRPMMFRYTDGVQFVAEHAQCYWLLDLIGSHQPELRKKYDEEKIYFQVWKLSKQGDGSWLAICEDGNNGLLTQQAIEYSSFPLPFFEMWYVNGVLILPSEY